MNPPPPKRTRSKRRVKSPKSAPLPDPTAVARPSRSSVRLVGSAELTEMKAEMLGAQAEGVNSAVLPAPPPHPRPSRSSVRLVGGMEPTHSETARSRGEAKSTSPVAPPALPQPSHSSRSAVPPVMFAVPSSSSHTRRKTAFTDMGRFSPVLGTPSAFGMYTRTVDAERRNRKKPALMMIGVLLVVGLTVAAIISTLLWHQKNTNFSKTTAGSRTSRRGSRSTRRTTTAQTESTKDVSSKVSQPITLSSGETAGTSPTSKTPTIATKCPRNPIVPFRTPVVNTTVGQINGITLQVDDVELHCWLAVPYALSTFGASRFKPPVPLNASEDRTIEAVQCGPQCPQVEGGIVVGSEDCLHMNVWAPAKSEADGAKRPLVFALAAEWYERGPNVASPWEVLAAKAGVVVMSPNVRLGLLGFLRPAGALAPAVEDAMTAVTWAVDNAAAFDADPSRIMLVGHGSGAYLLVEAAAALNLTCERAVLEGPLPGYVEPLNILGRLIGRLGCRDTDPWTCVATASLEDLFAATAEVRAESRFCFDKDGYLLFRRHQYAPLNLTDVIAIINIAEARTFFEEEVKALAVALGKGGSVAELYRFTLKCLVGRQSERYLRLLEPQFQPQEEADIVFILALLLSGCEALRVAYSAIGKSYHYITDAAGWPFFEPVLDMAAVAAFLANGSVPSMKSGLVLKASRTSPNIRLPFANGTEDLLGNRTTSICEAAFDPEPH